MSLYFIHKIIKEKTWLFILKIKHIQFHMMKKVLCHCPQVPHIHLLVLQNSTFFDKTELIEKEIKE